MEKFEVLSERDHCLKRPGVWIGSIEAEEQWGIVDYQYQSKVIVPGLVTIVREVLQNSIDEHIRTDGKFADKIDIRIEQKKNRWIVTIKDNGRGIPVKLIDGVYQPRLAWTSLRAGSNFGDDGRVTAGLNGVGVSLTNIFSLWFQGETSDGNETYRLTCKNNADPELTQEEFLTAKADRYTVVRFEPDLKRFGLTEFTQDHIDVLQDMIEQLSIVFKDIRFSFNGKKIKFANMKKLGEAYNTNVYDSTDNVTVLIGPAGDDQEFRHLTYINGIYVKDGGSPVDYVMGQITGVLRDKIKRKHKIDVLPNQIKQHLFLGVWGSGFEQLQFTSQTKERISNPIGDSAKYFDGISFDRIAQKILGNEQIIDPIIEAILYKKELEERRALKRKQKELDKKNLRKITKFTDANNKDRENSMLFLVEGDSANNPVLAVRRPFMGSFPLRGKVMNTSGMRPVDVLKNKELANVMAITGLTIGQKVESVDDLRFGKIVIFADQDFDGFHISGLLMAFFNNYWPELIKLGMLYRFQTPIVKVTQGKKNIPFYNIEAFKKWQETAKGTYKARYLKGLGSSTKEEFKEYFSDEGLKQNLHQITADDDGLKTLDMVFSKEGGSADERKEWLDLVAKSA